jgi:hypothetical protein
MILSFEAGDDAAFPVSDSIYQSSEIRFNMILSGYRVFSFPRTGRHIRPGFFLGEDFLTWTTCRPKYFDTFRWCGIATERCSVMLTHAPFRKYLVNETSS